jgi:hypothetical protein
MNPVFSGKIEKGKVLLDNPNRYLVQLSKLEGQRVEVVLRKQRAARSNNQNSYMWGVVYEIISEHLGYSTEEIHEIMKYKFLRATMGGGGKVYELVKSTAKLNTAEMETYLENIRRFAATELNCFIPLPNEVEAA